jgi:hypothetical protein
MESGALTGTSHIEIPAKAAPGGGLCVLARCFGLTVEPGGPIGTPMINASTSIIARRRRIIAVWAVVCV